MSAFARISIKDAWQAAVAVTAAAYGVAPELISVPSRGRGPRPASEVWEPRKMAVHLAIVLADCSYAALGRTIGLHRDTVASHCAEVRDAVLDQQRAETASTALEKLARARLAQLQATRIDALRAYLAQIEESVGDLLAGGLLGVSSDNIPTNPPTDLAFAATDHGNVITLVGTPRPHP